MQCVSGQSSEELDCPILSPGTILIRLPDSTESDVPAMPRQDQPDLWIGSQPLIKKSAHEPDERRMNDQVQIQAMRVQQGITGARCTLRHCRFRRQPR